ncbi:hypothetical protein LB450_04690 [Psychroflexus sp. CAK1W]|uniref:hypothetical protein n=1 Tax=Psychroflexus curvus TaxID=2873595 RepID=UPI001CCC1A19|nr:hypothetical protein [Psychroflexus curvus]MBZ9627393.1 hypothetical protein [Psychroflexus curvus]
MKDIHFGNLYARRYFMPVLLGLTIFLILYLIFEDTGHAKFFNLILNFVALILLSRMFWYKAHVQYNTSRISIKIISRSHINIKYDDITHIDYAETKLIIKENTKTHTINLEGVNPKDIQRLVSLMVERSDAFYTDSSKLNCYEKN